VLHPIDGGFETEIVGEIASMVALSASGENNKAALKGAAALGPDPVMPASILGPVPPGLLESQHKAAVERAEIAAANFRATVGRASLISDAVVERAETAAANFRAIMERASLISDAVVERAETAAANFRATVEKAGLISDCRVVECLAGDVAPCSAFKPGTAIS
jgi:hypothetical protein